MRFRVRVLGVELLDVDLSDDDGDNGRDPGDVTSSAHTPTPLGFSRWEPAPGGDEL